MKSKPNLYAPLLIGAILILAGVSAPLISFLQTISQGSFLAITIVQLLVFLLPLAFYSRVRGLNPLNVLKFGYPPLKKIPFLIVMILIFFTGILFFRYLGLFLVDSAFLETPDIISLPEDGGNRILMVLCTVFLPAILEETVFRGILLEEYRSYGSFFAVGVTSVMFALAHLSFENFLYYLFVGAMLGCIVQVCDTVLPAILIHIAMNASYFSLRPSVVEYLRQAGKSPLLLYLIVAALILLFVLLFSRLENLYQDRAYDEMLQSRKELLRKEVEYARLQRNREETPDPKEKFTKKCKEVFLSPTFLATCAIFLILASGLFSE